MLISVLLCNIPYHIYCVSYIYSMCTAVCYQNEVCAMFCNELKFDGWVTLASQYNSIVINTSTVYTVMFCRCVSFVKWLYVTCEAVWKPHFKQQITPTPRRNSSRGDSIIKNRLGYGRGCQIPPSWKGSALTMTVLMLITWSCRWLRKQFEEADKDNNGSLNFNECCALLKQLNLKMDKTHAKKLFNVSFCGLQPI